MLLFCMSRVEDCVVPHPCAPAGEFIPGFTGSLVFQIVMWWALAGRTQMEESVTQQLSQSFPRSRSFWENPGCTLTSGNIGPWSSSLWETIAASLPSAESPGSGVGEYTLVWSWIRWHFFLFPLWPLRKDPLPFSSVTFPGVHSHRASARFR